MLVEPQLGENIGTAARAMANFGLIRPPRRQSARGLAEREGAGGGEPRAGDRRGPRLRDAGRGGRRPQLSLCHHRPLARGGQGGGRSARGGGVGARPHRRRAGVGILFGRERSGLTNEEVSLADAILTLPVDPAFSSLNIAQAVLIVAYEWRLSGFADEAAGVPFDGRIDPPAPREELVRMFEHFEGALDRAGFFRPPEKRGHMVLALRAMLQRAGLTEQEVRTLRGVIAAFDRRPTRPHPRADGTVSTERDKPEQDGT